MRLQRNRLVSGGLEPTDHLFLISKQMISKQKEKIFFCYILTPYPLKKIGVYSIKYKAYTYAYA